MTMLPFLILLPMAYSQLIATFGNITLTLTSANNLSLTQDPASPQYPNDFYRRVQLGVTNLYALGSNNIVEVYNKADPSQQVQIFKDYTYEYSLPFEMVDMTINDAQNMIILTSYHGSTLKHLVFELTSAGITTLQNITGFYQVSTQHYLVFLKDNEVYTYFRDGSANDFFVIVNFWDNSSRIITTDKSNCKVAIPPNKQKILVWDERSNLYIYSLPNLTLLYTYTESSGSPAFRTDMIGFSSDSQMAVLESDNSNPVRVINLTDYSTIANITIHGTIYSSTFLDPANRFIFIKSDEKDYVYDLGTSLLGRIDEPTFLFSTIADSSVSQLFGYDSSTISSYQLNLVDGQTTIMSYSSPEEPENDIPTQNETIPAQTPTNSQTAEYVIVLDLSEGENKTLNGLGGAVSGVGDTVDTTFSVIFSTPLAIYFFSSFNYFILSSLYVFLNIAIPDVVFHYLEQLSTSYQSDALSLFGGLSSPQPLSEERVNEKRAQYFKISSDLISVNFTSAIVLAANVLFYELLIFVFGPKLWRKKNVYRTLSKERMAVYWGLVMSNMVPLILTWKFSLWGGTTNWPSALNLQLQYLVLMGLAFLLTVSFIHEFKQARKEEHRVKSALREWWCGYENFIYPSLLLLQNPLYFMVVIGASNLFALYNSFYVTSWKLLNILKGLYPLLFHSCFIVFMTSRSNSLLVYASIACLSIFLVGSLHHFLEAIITAVRSIIRMIKKNVQCLKVKPVDDSKKPVNIPEPMLQIKEQQKPSKQLKVKFEAKKNHAKVKSLVQQKIQRLKSQNQSQSHNRNKNKTLNTKIDEQSKQNKSRFKKSKDTKNNKELSVVWNPKKTVTFTK